MTNQHPNPSLGDRPLSDAGVRRFTLSFPDGRCIKGCKWSNGAVAFNDDGAGWLGSLEQRVLGAAADRLGKDISHVFDAAEILMAAQMD